MSKWKTYKLEDAIEKLIDYRGKTPSKTQSGIPLVTAKVIKNGRIEKTNEFIAEEDYESWMRRGIPKYGDVVLTTEAPLGEVAQILTNKKIALAQRVITLRGKTGLIDNSFLKYFLVSPVGQNNLKAKETGSTVTGIKQSELRKVEILAPDLPTQKEIAQILSSLDDKIELNLQMNQTLEAMAQAIFKEWFVNFNFPGFDGELVDGLPKGWRVGVLGELVEKLSKGTTPTQKDLGSLEVQIPFLKVKDISDNGTIIKNNLELIPIEVHQNQLKRSVLQTDDILFSIAGTIGRVAILDNTLNNSNCNQAIAFIRLTEKSKYLEYVHQWLKSETIQNNIKSSIVQGVQANVSLTVLSNIDIVIPDDTTIEHWNSLIKPTYSRLLTNTHQIENLTQTRDTLLPKLMSGQLEVAV